MPQRTAIDAADRPAVRAECFLLCDYVRVENGKLFILGGGWDQIVPAHLPVPYPFYIAIKLVVPAAVATEPIHLRMDVVDEEGQELGDPPLDARVSFTPKANVASAPETVFPEGQALLPLFAEVTLFQPGAYTLRLVANGQLVGITRFTVSPPPVTPR